MFQCSLLDSCKWESSFLLLYMLLSPHVLDLNTISAEKPEDKSTSNTDQEVAPTDVSKPGKTYVMTQMVWLFGLVFTTCCATTAPMLYYYFHS